MTNAKDFDWLKDQTFNPVDLSEKAEEADSCELCGIFSGAPCVGFCERCDRECCEACLGPCVCGGILECKDCRKDCVEGNRL